jgi:hypothetical protein
MIHHEVAASPSERLEYGAVPLDPDHVCDVDGRPYGITSLERITEKLEIAMAKAKANGWVESDDLMREYHAMLEVSLYDSQVRRMLENGLSSKVDLNDPEVTRALNGFAGPGELLGLLDKYPGLESIELAKLSHPLDAVATAEMDIAVADAIDTAGGELAFEVPRYKLKTVRSDLPAVTILRKQIVGSTAQGIQIVSKKAFLVRGDHEVRRSTDGRYIDRKVRNSFGYDEEGHVKEGTRFGELTQELESELLRLHEYPYLNWLQPIATSYYAKYLPE